ncbi:MAG: protein kinase [Deltaproteobacteria bacterium]|nr:protein kinase [Deltaproteobacteria bacterium]
MPLCPTCNGRFVEGTFCPKDGTALIADGQLPTSLVGQVIGRKYRLTRLLGQGGMGEVYAAQHVHITKRVAVKILHPEISNNPEALARFRQEAQSASSIGHDNIVAIDDFDQLDDGRYYLCMEFLDGESLAAAMVIPGGMAIARVINIALQVCDGLDAAHQKGIVHRDMKPENVFLTRRSDGSELVKILDFGIAKVSGTDENNNLTKTGTVFGTPHYMSPEQALGQKVDRRADIYSVGVMLFEVFTGQVPFKAESFMGILSQHITKDPPLPSTVTPGRAIPLPVEQLILKAMAKEPSKRFSSAAELKQALLAAGQQLGPHVITPTQMGNAQTLAPGAGIAKVGVPGTQIGAGAIGSQATIGQIPRPTPPGSAQPPLSPTPQGTPAAQWPSGGNGVVPPTIAAPQMTPPSGAGAAIPPTMLAAQAGAPTPAGLQAAPVMPTPAVAGPGGFAAPATSPAFSSGLGQKKKKTGLIIALAITLVVLGGGAAAAALFWDELMGVDNNKTTAGVPPVAAADAGVVDAKVAVALPPDAAAQAPDTREVAETPPDAATVAPDLARAIAVATPPRVGRRPSRPPRRPLNTKTQPATTVDPPPRDPPPSDPPPKDPPPSRPPAAKKSHYQLRLVTVPSGASILAANGMQRLGHSPISFKLRPGESKRVRIAKSGYQEMSVTLHGADEDSTKTIRLRKGRSGASIGIPGSDPF